jgi:arylsulfatase A-like enzyme
MDNSVNQKKPNILFLFTDDQRYDTIRSLGNPDIHTPNMDWLVDRGTAFTHAHVMGGMNGAICIPSRAMMLSGRTLFEIEGIGREIPATHVTLPEAMRQAGYTTFHTGKWHNDRKSHARSFSAGAAISGFKRGWYEKCDGHWHVDMQDFDPTGQYPEERGYYANEPIEPFTLPYTRYKENGIHSSEIFSNAAIDFINSYDRVEPFFMYVAFRAPHDPRQSPKAFWDIYDPERIPLPASFNPRHPFDNGDLTGRDEMLEGFPRTPWAIKRHIADYYAIISHLDEQIGRIVNALRQRGTLDNTIIVLAGDNGLAVGRHGLMGKQNLYDHSVRVPLIISGPGIPQGLRSDALCYLSDLYPTLCELVQVPVPDSVTGVSLAPRMQGGRLKARNTLYCGYKSWQRSIRSGGFKLIEYMVDNVSTTQLFNLTEDPDELHNLAHETSCKDLLLELRKELLRCRDVYKDTGKEGESFWSGYLSLHGAALL